MLFRSAGALQISYGKRESKYQFLWERNLEQIGFEELEPQSPQYFFVPKDYALQEAYDRGFSVSDLFAVNSVGIVTARDHFALYHTPRDLKAAIAKFRTMDDNTAREQYSLGKDADDWKVKLARQDLEENVFGNANDKPVPICYRPFDVRYTYYTGTSKGFHCRPRGEFMRHLLEGENLGLIFSRRSMETGTPVFVTRTIIDKRGGHSWAETISCLASLYLYPDPKQQTLDKKQTRKPNLDPAIVQTIAVALDLRFTPEKEADPKTFAPIDLLDYIYAILHSPAYRHGCFTTTYTGSGRASISSCGSAIWSRLISRS